MTAMNSSEEVFDRDLAFDSLVEAWGEPHTDADGAVEPLGCGAEACFHCNTSADCERKLISSGPAWAVGASEPMKHDLVQQVSMTLERADLCPVLPSMCTTRTYMHCRHLTRMIWTLDGLR